MLFRTCVNLIIWSILLLTIVQSSSADVSELNGYAYGKPSDKFPLQYQSALVPVASTVKALFSSGAHAANPSRTGLQVISANQNAVYENSPIIYDQVPPAKEELSKPITTYIPTNTQVASTHTTQIRPVSGLQVISEPDVFQVPSSTVVPQLSGTISTTLQPQSSFGINQSVSKFPQYSQFQANRAEYAGKPIAPARPVSVLQSNLNQNYQSSARPVYSQTSSTRLPVYQPNRPLPFSNARPQSNINAYKLPGSQNLNQAFQVTQGLGSPAQGSFGSFPGQVDQRRPSTTKYQVSSAPLRPVQTQQPIVPLVSTTPQPSTTFRPNPNNAFLQGYQPISASRPAVISQRPVSFPTVQPQTTPTSSQNAGSRPGFGGSQSSISQPIGEEYFSTVSKQIKAQNTGATQGQAVGLTSGVNRPSPARDNTSRRPAFQQQGTQQFATLTDEEAAKEADRLQHTLETAQIIENLSSSAQQAEIDSNQASQVAESNKLDVSIRHSDQPLLKPLVTIPSVKFQGTQLGQSGVSQRFQTSNTLTKQLTNSNYQTGQIDGQQPLVSYQNVQTISSPKPIVAYNKQLSKTAINQNKYQAFKPGSRTTVKPQPAYISSQQGLLNKVVSNAGYTPNAQLYKPAAINTVRPQGSSQQGYQGATNAAYSNAVQTYKPAAISTIRPQVTYSSSQQAYPAAGLINKPAVNAVYTQAPAIAAVKPQAAYSSSEQLYQGAALINKPAVNSYKPIAISTVRPQDAYGSSQQAYQGPTSTPAPQAYKPVENTTLKPQAISGSQQQYQGAALTNKPAANAYKPITISTVRPQQAYQGAAITSAAQLYKPVAITTPRPQTGYSSAQQQYQGAAFVSKPAYKPAAISTVRPQAAYGSTQQAYQSAASSPAPQAYKPVAITKPKPQATYSSSQQQYQGAALINKPAVNSYKPIAISTVRPQDAYGSSQQAYQGPTSTPAPQAYKPVENTTLKPQAISGSQQQYQGAALTNKPAANAYKPITISTVRPQQAYQGAAITSAAQLYKPVAITTPRPQTGYSSAQQQYQGAAFVSKPAYKPAAISTVRPQAAYGLTQQAYQSAASSPAPQAYKPVAITKPKPQATYSSSQQQYQGAALINKPAVNSYKPIAIAPVRPQVAYGASQQAYQSAVNSPTPQAYRPVAITTPKPQAIYSSSQQQYQDAAFINKPANSPAAQEYQPGPVTTERPQTASSASKQQSQDAALLYKPAANAALVQAGKPDSITTIKPSVSFAQSQQGYQNEDLGNPIVTPSEKEEAINRFGNEQSTNIEEHRVENDYLNDQELLFHLNDPLPVFSQSSIPAPQITDYPSSFTDSGILQDHGVDVNTLSSNALFSSFPAKPQIGFGSASIVSGSPAPFQSVFIGSTAIPPSIIESHSSNFGLSTGIGSGVQFQSPVIGLSEPSAGFNSRFGQSNLQLNAVSPQLKLSSTALPLSNAAFVPKTFTTVAPFTATSVRPTLGSFIQQPIAEIDVGYLPPLGTSAPGRSFKASGILNLQAPVQLKTLTSKPIQSDFRFASATANQVVDAALEQHIAEAQERTVGTFQEYANEFNSEQLPKVRRVRQISLEDFFGKAADRVPLDTHNSIQYSPDYLQTDDEPEVQPPKALTYEEQQVRKHHEKSDSDKEDHAIKSLYTGSHIGPHINKNSDQEYNVFDYDQYSIDPMEEVY